MPNINLLPWREDRRAEQQREFVVILGMTIVVAAVCVGVSWLSFNMLIEHQRERNMFVEARIAVLDKRVAEIAGLRKRRDDMLERMRIIQDLQGNRPVIIRVFDELVRTLPEGVTFDRLSLVDQKLSISGTAESNSRVSSLMRKLDGSDWFTKPNLTQVKANIEYGEQASDFTMSVSLVLPGAREPLQTAEKSTRQDGRKPRRRS